MTDHELAACVARLHGLAAERARTRGEFIQLRDIVPRPVAQFCAQLVITNQVVMMPAINDPKTFSPPTVHLPVRA